MPNGLKAVCFVFYNPTSSIIYYVLPLVCGKLITTANQVWLPVLLIVIKWMGLNALCMRSTVRPYQVNFLFLGFSGSVFG